ncbi:MAG TPA: ABC transporter permease [Gemmatimonadaceae bacterium]|nr:ABC transporter permease [Gemmatimonadaceae bacterium]
MSLLARVRGSLLWPMLWKEFVQMRRDRFTLAMMVGVPAMQLVLFGYAIRTDVRRIPAVVLDESRSSESRALVQTMEATQSFRIVGAVSDRRELERRVANGDAHAAIVIPPGYATDVRRGRTATAQVIVDAADPMSSSSAMSGAMQAANARAAEMTRALSRRPPPLEVRVRPWYNPGLVSSTYIVPGIVGLLLMLTLMLITAIAIVRERERGTLEQLIVTPVGKTSIMLGKILPFLLVGYVQMTVVLALGALIFRVPMRGSVVVLYGLSLAFMVAMLGQGLIVSTLARTQGQAMQLGFMMMMPNILLSGFMFPVAAMPRPIQLLSAVLPLTYYLEVVRGVALRGVGLEALWQEALVLTGFAVGLVGLSVRRFRKTLD